MIFRIRYTKVWYDKSGINRLKEFEVYTSGLKIDNSTIVTDSGLIVLDETVKELYIDLV